MKIRVHHNGDDTLVAWSTDTFIPDCRGFALLRRRNGVEETVSTWVGFAGESHEDGERRASINWPIQKYQWSDYMVKPGDRLQYRVVPMVGPNRQSLHPVTALASDWSPVIRLTHDVEDGIGVYFNRGIVASQWVSRRLGITATDAKSAKLTKIIATPGDAFRNYLAGPLGERLVKLLKDAAADQRQVYAALYELNDPELIALLVKCRKRAHVVLANGSVKKKGEDQNEDARDALSGKVDLHDRMRAPAALAHNKFLVVCDGNGKSRWVWTGSQNWTMTGLCTQANNSVLIDDRKLAQQYLTQWELLRDAKDQSPPSLKQSNSQVRKLSVSGTPARLWFTPTVGQVDLDDARALIQGAKSAILFLMFNPGPKDSLLNSIIRKTRQTAAGKRLYVKGAINQDPSTTQTPVELFDGRNSEKADYDVVLPAAIDQTTGYWRRELLKLPKARAMVHSKVVVIDPFSEHPIVITGSHNLGPKASGTNDENLLIFRDAPGLAAAYATNILSVYGQYRWRFRRKVQPVAKRWKGLEDGDQWQQWYLKPGSPAKREMKFWVE